EGERYEPNSARVFGTANRGIRAPPWHALNLPHLDRGRWANRPRRTRRRVAQAVVVVGYGRPRRSGRLAGPRLPPSRAGARRRCTRGEEPADRPPRSRARPVRGSRKVFGDPFRNSETARTGRRAAV